MTQAIATQQGASPASPSVEAFYDATTSTLTYVVSCPTTGRCIIVDPVLDLDYASGTLTTRAADRVADYIESHSFTVELILETHVHADHLSAAPYLQARLGGQIGIGQHITTVQSTFAEVFNEDASFARDGSQFNRMFADGETFHLGTLECEAIHVPGHTPACMAYRVGDALFVGDTLFMPDGGTARCDFPGGDARTLFRSVKRLLSHPEETRIFVCHDYQPNGRAMAFESSVGAQRRDNIHIHDGIDEQQFVELRESRDAGLAMPTLILPSLQVNMRAGLLPGADSDGRFFLKVPLNMFGGAKLTTIPADNN